jgi:hypothetical protein
MVSGLVTSPKLHERISSGEAIFTWMKLKSVARVSRLRGKSIMYVVPFV